MTFCHVKKFLISWGIYPSGVKKSSITSTEYELLFREATHIGGMGSHLEFFIPAVLSRKEDELSLPYDSWGDIEAIWEGKLP